MSEKKLSAEQLRPYAYQVVDRSLLIAMAAALPPEQREYCLQALKNIKNNEHFDEIETIAQEYISNIESLAQVYTMTQEQQAD